MRAAARASRGARDSRTERDFRTGLDRVLEDAAALAGRRYGVLAHQAAVSSRLEPIHLALVAAGAPVPAALFGPEHGFYGAEQDMVGVGDGRDPWTGAPLASLYGDSEASLEPSPEAFSGLDLLLVDLQDVGSRYYTYAATAAWACEAALAAGCEVWVLDRPNPLGGELVEGNLRRPGFESFVGAFELPVRHGLTLGELVLLEARRRGWSETPRVVAMSGWTRGATWEELGRAWVPPSPNVPTPDTARVYPGACLVEATEFSEGRGTTEPFQLVGGPGVDARRLAERLSDAALAGVAFAPACFRPVAGKHGGELCGGVRWAVTDPAAARPYRCGVEILAALREVAPESFAWREAPYEFVADRPAIDLLAGCDDLRRALEAGEGLDAWIASWAADEEAFRRERRAALLYPEQAEPTEPPEATQAGERR